MARVVKPNNKVTVLDPVDGMMEAPTTDLVEMARRAKNKAKADIEKSVEYNLKTKKKK